MKRSFLIILISLIIALTYLIQPLSVATIIILNSDPPAAVMVNKMKDQIECARRAGFIIAPPILRTMRGPYRFDSPQGQAYMRYNIVTLADYATFEILAHELGHIIDWQSKRKGHPFFIGKENLNVQEFADAVKHVILNECIKSGK